jgi:predicted phage terminase large subunit-like protein
MTKLLDELQQAKREILLRRILNNPFIPIKPTLKQLEFLLNFKKEGLYGGAAGGGKSVALLVAALMFVEIPEYKGLLLRRSYSQLNLPGALIDMAHAWLGPTEATWSGQEKQWRFPSGASLNFGYLDTEADKYRYQGAAFHFVGFDELTQFQEGQYTYLFSRARKQIDSPIPIRVRGASNPGGVGHDWVKRRFFIDEDAKDRFFIPAGLDDNPHLDKEDYEKQLDKLDPVTKRQLKLGDWDVVPGGNFFKREKFEIVDDYPRSARAVRYWDLAATEAKAGTDPDYTAGVLMCEQGGKYWIIDVVRERKAPSDIEKLIKQTAELDGRRVEIFMEQEPGSAGVALIEHYTLNTLKGFAFKGIKTTGNKADRSRPMAAAVDNENVKIVRGPWNKIFIEECVVFPQKEYHDDQVDAASGSFAQLATSGPVQISSSRVNRVSKVTQGY